MWMVDCDDRHHVKDFKAISIGRKLRPLMPRPITPASVTATTTMNCVFSTLPSACFCTSINPNIIAWSQPISMQSTLELFLSDYGIKREINRVPLVSPRWNPTPEQLQALEDLYRRGLRTPSAQQIQHIAAKLRRFGKIEGKNVFYWFQNHKARERQKKRRLLELHASKKLHHADAIQAQKTGCSRENMELDHVKKQSSTFSNSSTPSQDSVSFHAAVVATEWTKLEQRELQQQAKNEQTCWQLDLSSCMPSNIINKNVVISEDIIINNPDRENEKPSSSLNISLLSPPEDDEIRNQTLPLFPIKSHGPSTLHTTSDEEINDVSSIGMSFTPNEFYEFLPTKN
ncbi:uncharacterized protein [Henckelia pumila]|uniref:uncharacterized protein n=1 Tax=Henckelia pumila TaxID=405737 RepID=UPI003C6E6D8F